MRWSEGLTSLAIRMKTSVTSQTPIITTNDFKIQNGNANLMVL